MKKKIGDLTEEEIDKECNKHLPHCNDNGLCPLWAIGNNYSWCMVLLDVKEKYKDKEIEVEENEKH